MESEPPLSYPLLQLAFVIIQFWGITFGVFVLLILLLCSALISGSEVAFFSLTRRDLHELEEENSTSGRRIVHLKNSPRSLLATILISNNFINIAIVLVSNYILRHVLPQEHFLRWGDAMREAMPWADWLSAQRVADAITFLIAVVGVTFFLVLFGEIAPKIYANIRNRRFAKFMALPLSILSFLFGPLSRILVRWSNRIERRVDAQRQRQTTTNREELGKAIELAVGHIDDSTHEEADILKGIVKFSDVTVKQIMKSRVDVVALDITATFNDVLKIVKDTGYSRVPVFTEDFDNITGVLYVKDLLGYTEESDGFEWQQLIRSNVLYAPEAKKINDLLKEFQQKRLHMAIVVDEFGGSAGIVTLEDIMEEVIGDIKDEFDDEKEVEYLKIDNHNFIFEGKTLLNDVCKIIGVDTEVFETDRGDADSLAGLILELVGFIPKVDKEITYKQFKFKIISVTNRRIEKVNVYVGEK